MAWTPPPQATAGRPGERRALWDVEQQRLITAVHRALAAVDSDPATASSPDARKRAKADLDAQLKQLEALQKGFEDPGPIHGVQGFPRPPNAPAGVRPSTPAR